MLVTALLISISSLSAQIDIGARPEGMGGAFTAVSNDANAPRWNPAGIELFRERALTAGFTKKYWGIEGDNLMKGYAAYIHHLGKRGRYGSFAFSWAQFFSSTYSEMELSLSYSKMLFGSRLGKNLSLGVNGKMLRYGFNSSNFVDFEPADPIFSDSYSRLGFTADVGLLWRAASWLSIGAVAKNITEPEMAISGVTDGTGKVPMEVRGGVALWLPKGITPTFDVEYVDEKIGNSSQILFHFGAEKNFGRAFGLRAGYNRKEACLGASYNLVRDKFNILFDYGFLYPVATELSDLYVTTHKFGITAYFAPPPVPLEELELVGGKVEIYPRNAIIGQEVTIRFSVLNRGEKDEHKVKLSIYYQDKSGNWVMALPVQRFDISIGEKKEMVFNWTPPDKGAYEIYCAVDDDGSRLPDIHGKVEEVDEDNNTGVGQLDVFSKPKGSVIPKDRYLKVSKVSIYQEEEPIIPVVFFDEGKAELDPRFDRMLSTVARRMKENPDVVLDIRGFYSRGSDKVDDQNALAGRRAEVVKNKLLSLGMPAGQVKVVEADYDRGASRSGTPEEQLNPTSKKLQEEENRRVELDARLVKDFEIDLKLPSVSIPADVRNKIDAGIEDIQSILERNSEVIILVEGYSPPDADKDAVDISFRKAAAVADYIKSKLPDKLSERIYIHSDRANDATGDEVAIFPNGEGVIFRPREGDQVIEDYAVEGSEENYVKIEASVDAGVDSFTVMVIDEDGNRVRLLAAGKGQIPQGLSWDWRDDAGQMLDFDKRYYIKMDIRDKLGELFVSTSDTMAIEVTKSEKRIETLVIVEFVFNEYVPQSKFLESRVQYVARRFIRRAEKKYTNLEALISGHTDIIGAEYANRQLSRQRAERELDNLRRYMMYLLGLNTQGELDHWLADHNIKLKAKGFWEKNPYTITRWVDGKLEHSLLGNNELPEGRTINRRVLLELKAEKISEEQVQ